MFDDNHMTITGFPPISHDDRGFTFYKMSNLDSRISNADQLLTQVCRHHNFTLREFLTTF